MAPSPPSTLPGPRGDSASMMAWRLPSRPATCKQHKVVQREALRRVPLRWPRQRVYNVCQLAAPGGTEQGAGGMAATRRDGEDGDQGKVGRSQQPAEACTARGSPSPRQQRSMTCLLRDPVTACLHGAKRHVLAAQAKVPVIRRGLLDVTT